MDFFLIKILVLKGLIIVDGVSLIIFGLIEDIVIIFLILYMISEMIFLEKMIGFKVNIECDMIGKYMY